MDMQSPTRGAAGAGTAVLRGDPIDLHWTQLSSERYMRLIDENFIHFDSDFTNGLSDLAAVMGTAPGMCDGKLVVGGHSLYKTQFRPKAAWCTIVLSIDTLPVAGASSQAGPALVKDARNYIACVYDAVAKQFKTVVNGSVIMVKNAGFATRNIVLYMICTANQVTFWADGPAGRVFVGTVENTLSDLLNDGALDGYGYGIYCDQDAGAPILVAGLKAGVCGGVGTLNVRQVMHEDNSPYFHQGKLLFTADFEQVGTREYFNFTLGNSTLFWLDMDTFEVGTLGRYYFRRSNFSEPGAVKVVGGAAIKLTWHASRKQWLMNYTFADWPNMLMGNTDVYLWLEPGEIFGERVFDSSRFNIFGRRRNGFLLFDSRAYKVGDLWYLMGPQTNSPEGAPYQPTEPVKPAIHSGVDLADLDGYVERTMPGMSSEGYTIARFGGRLYAIGWTNGSNKGWVFTFPGLEYLGDLRLPFEPHTEFPGFDFVIRQGSGKSSYYLVGFDNDALSLTDVEGKTASYMWARGKLTVFKADEEAGVNK